MAVLHMDVSEHTFAVLTTQVQEAVQKAQAADEQEGITDATTDDDIPTVVETLASFLLDRAILQSQSTTLQTYA